jgi:NCS1 family nucleobase:cation symporter-1
MLAIGLSWCASSTSFSAQKTVLSDLAFNTRRQAVPCIAAAYAIISIVIVLTGTIGARLHVAFPVLNRSSFGFWFSYFTVFSRVILSMFWFSIQVTIAAHCITVMFMNPFSRTMGPNVFIRCIPLSLPSFRHR